MTNRRNLIQVDFILGTSPVAASALGSQPRHHLAPLLIHQYMEAPLHMKSWIQ